MRQITERSTREFRLNWSSIILLLLGGTCLFESIRLSANLQKMEPLGAGGWPIILSVFWLVSILGVMAFEYFKQQPVSSYKIDIHDARTRRWVLIVSLILIYIFVVSTAGFVMTTIGFEFAMMIGLGITGKRNLLIAAIAAVTVTLTIYFCYTLAFGIPLPGQL